jgi:hypothetical protein
VEVDSIAAIVTPSATSQSRITPSERVIVANVRVCDVRRPALVLGVRTQTVTDALPTSSPATRSNITSIPTNPFPSNPPTGVDRRASPGRSSARTQTHALYGSNQAATRRPRAIHLNGLHDPYQCVPTSPDDTTILILRRSDLPRSQPDTPHAPWRYIRRDVLEEAANGPQICTATGVATPGS